MSMVVERSGGCWRQAALGHDDVARRCRIEWGPWARSLADVVWSGCSGGMACCGGGWSVVNDDGGWWQQLVRVVAGSVGRRG